MWRINISGYVLALQCYELSGDLRSLKTFYQRIKLFLREFEERKLNEANSRDYYSNVERLYIELIRYQISQYARDPSDLSEC